MSHYVHVNPGARDWIFESAQAGTEATVLAFHQTLSEYNETELHSLPQLAKELGLGTVVLKDESNRFGLPAFKILGASWAVYQAVGAHLGLDLADGQTSLEELSRKANGAGISIMTCTDGNCGRAIARMAKHLHIPVRVFVPSFVTESTRAKIRSEGAEVIEVDGSYDDAIAVIRKEAEVGQVVLVLDVSFERYEVVPTYFVQGYSTMLAESDRQVLQVTGGKPATHAFVPCGAGSISEAVTAHFKSGKRKHEYGQAWVIAVEPTAAACLQMSIKAGRSISVETGDTIMAGMNCGTLSTTAWPILQAGVDASVVVTDMESHAAVEELTESGILAGPCGAATVAALRRTCADSREELGLGADSVVVLYCTEGAREYDLPK
ncbi:tryptophan synthase beta subunit-like PLP-dependent enzyme [Xylariomycetidae sp. FL0641]|nr:tryptophan synthase beta subunit-like PLP-dependent enzyme [Xylariomycetidae sp. FL0641]